MSGIQNQRMGTSAAGASALSQIDRPVTASSQGVKIRELQDELKKEQKEKKRLID
jgi:hypothetical protein